MGMKFGFLGGILVLLALGLVSCGTSSVTGSSSSGILYVAAQGNVATAGVSAYGVDLTSGVVSNSNYGVKSGNMPGPIVISPSGNALYVADIQDNAISSYAVNADGTLAPASSTTPTGVAPLGLAIDPAGKFLYVANQGTFADPTSGTISAFAVSAGLTPVGSPVSTATPGVTVGTGPVSVAVSANGNFLYVANQFTNTVSGYSLSSGVLTLVGGSPYPVGTSPSAVTMSPDGNFVFVANTGTNNISVFSACTATSLNCSVADGHLSPVAGSPFSAGLGPIALTAVMPIAGDEYLFVVDHNSNQISQYKVASGTGVLTPASPATLSTGAGPSALVVRAGNGVALADGGITDYLYVTNATAGTISSYTFDTTQGVLSLVTGSTTIATPGQPAGIVAK